MKIYTGDSTIKLAENLIETSNQVVTHLVLSKGQAVPQHHAKYTVIVVPIKGKIVFSDENKSETIYPGKIVQMIPDELHDLKALEDSELMVVKSTLA
ncbi:MAG TPA: cupin [Tetragenococcus sp.]|nr:cupin [Tetragenococcus sp.]